MCGIVGYTGQNNASPIILEGLGKLEYRGYDSAGIATICSGDFMVAKSVGALSNLISETKNGETLKGNIGIGHNRWATHGKPNIKNAHPHIGTRFALVHNGIIENESYLKINFLANENFESSTDTEVVLKLFEKFVKSGEEVCEAIRHLMSEIKGSYAIAIIDKNNPHTIYALKNKSPLLVGCGDGFNMVGSDIPAMLKNTNTFLEINDMEYVVITPYSADIFNLCGNCAVRNAFKTDIDAEDIEKGAYPHYMLKEIEEQPFVIRRIIKKYTNKDGNFVIDNNIIENIKKADKVYIIACGTSYHAGLVGKFYLENIAGITADAYIASEFIYNMPLISKSAFFIFISQSGETADSRSVLVKIKKMGHKCLAITNSAGSTLSRESDFTLYLNAGAEIAVASTKAYTAQVALMAILAVCADNKISINLNKELNIVANTIESLCLIKEKYKEIAKEFLKNASSCFYIGRGLDYYVSLEASLKLKEISYIHTEGFAAGELKHGPIALIEKNTPVIVFLTSDNVNLSTRANINEVKSRGANTVCISLDSVSAPDDKIVISSVHKFLTPLVSIIPAHFIAYFAALERGCDIDKPRNLAKSVTVE